MEKILIKSLSIEELKKSINELRDTLNELCATVNEVEDANEKLVMSEHLDELIVEYMYRISNKNLSRA